jgi:hypothetical protein
MASQRPGRDIPRLDYHAIAKVPRIDDESLATKPAAYPPVNPLITANPAIVGDAVDDVGDVIITRSTLTVAATNAEPTSLLNSTIYNDSEDDLPVTLSTSIQPLESASQVLLRVPRLQAKSRLRSPVFNHFITTLLDEYYILRQTKKRTQDR